MKKRLLAVLLVGLMFVLAACGGNGSTETTTEDDTTNQEDAAVEEVEDDDTEDDAVVEGDRSQTVRVITSVMFGKDDDEMRLFEAALSEAIGYNVEVYRPPADYDTILFQMLGAGEQFDLIQGHVAQLQSEGALLDITDWIAASPILSDTNIVPASEWDLIRIDGRIYSSFFKKEIQRVPTINAVTAQRAGIDITAIEPTLDGYLEVFRTMRDNIDDPGFYPINIALSQWFDLQPWFASTGSFVSLKTNDAGNWIAQATEPEAIPVWEWLITLYEEGLLDPDSFTDTTRELRDKMQAGVSGLVVDWAAWVGLYNNNAADLFPDEFEVVGLGGTLNPDGNYMLMRGGPAEVAIPANAANPEGGFALMEFMATEEGAMLMSAGLEGHDWENVNGEYVLLEPGLEHGLDHGAPLPVNVQFELPFPMNPGFREALEFLPYAITEEVNPNLGLYREIMARHAVRIITGQVDIEAGLEELRAELFNEGIIDE
jgi:putative aldouronate transport system substrate-binding protein